MNREAEVAAGARNLLVNCAGLSAGDDLLIIHERPDLGWYDLDAPMAVAAQARRLGMFPSLLEAGAPRNDRDPEVTRAIAAHGCSIFFARIGDQDRFADPPPGKTFVVCYTRSADMLGSAFGRTDHLALRDLKNAVDDILLAASRIEITCPLGTELSGHISPCDRQSRGDVTVHRFPLGVHQPIAASGFSGRVVLARYLTPTASKVYEPATVALERPAFAEVVSGRMESLSGEAAVVRLIREHHQRVADRFGIDRDVVHSWHAGIHPGCAYSADAAEDPDRWSNTVFNNPRFLHLHTCGDYAPGEICWMVLDPTVAVDGRNLWEDGRLRPGAFAPSASSLERWPELEALFARPSDRIGLAQ